MVDKKDDTEVAGSDAAKHSRDDVKPATTDPKLSDPEKTPGSGMTPNGGSDAPSG